jgi:hypothetical protein
MLSPVYFTDRPTRSGDPTDDAFLQRNFDLCRAINLNALHVVLDDMVEAGMPAEHRALFYASAQALLQLVRTENNRLRVAPPAAKIAQEAPAS